MKNKVIAMIFLMSCSVTATANAAEKSTAFADEKSDLALKMLELAETKKNHESIVASYIRNMSTNPLTKNEAFKGEEFKDTMQWKNVIGPMKDIYMESYTKEELRTIVDFFSSPAGQSFLKMSPEVSMKSVAVTQASIAKAMSTILQVK